MTHILAPEQLLRPLHTGRSRRTAAYVSAQGVVELMTSCI